MISSRIMYFSSFYIMLLCLMMVYDLPHSVYAKVISLPTLFCDLDSYEEKNPVPLCQGTCKSRDDYTRTMISWYARVNDFEIKLWTCMKWEVSIIYTETWTFSQLPPVETRTASPPRYDVCHMMIRNQCREGNCHIVPPLSNEKEYHWASDTHVYKEYYTLEQSRSTKLHITDNGPQIVVNNKPQDYQVGSHLDGNVMTIWETKLSYETIMKSHLVVKSEEMCFVTESKEIYCPMSGIAISKYHSIKDPETSKIQISDTGLLFALGKSRLADISTLPEKVEVDGLDPVVLASLDSIRQSLVYRDYLACLETCIDFQQEKETPQLLASRYYLPIRMRLHPCNLRLFCEIKYPLVHCENTTLIKALCDDEDVWVNLVRPYTVKNSQCGHHILHPNSLEISNIIINSSGIYLPVENDKGVTARIANSRVFQISHDSDRVSPYSITLVANHTLQQVVFDHFTWVHDLLEIPGKLFNFFSHTVRVIILLTVGGLLAYWSLRLFISISIKKRISQSIQSTQQFNYPRDAIAMIDHY